MEFLRNRETSLYPQEERSALWGCTQRYLMVIVHCERPKISSSNPRSAQNAKDTDDYRSNQIVTGPSLMISTNM